LPRDRKVVLPIHPELAAWLKKQTRGAAMRGCNPHCSPVGIIEVMADERWKRLAEQQGVAYAKTVAEAMNLELDMDNPADREKLRRAILDLVAGRKMPKQKGRN